MSRPPALLRPLRWTALGLGLGLALGGASACSGGVESPRATDAAAKPVLSGAPASAAPASAAPAAGPTADPAARLVAAGYLGSEACTSCHVDIARTYAASSKAHTLERPGPLPEGIVDDPPSGTRSRITQTLAGSEQRVVRVRHDDTVIETATRTAQLAIGAGRRVRTLATLEPAGRPGRADAWEMPFSWFAGAQRWGVSPGHSEIGLGPRFKIGPECLFCHSAAGALPAGLLTAGPGDPGPWRWVGIGCERCHGPGRAHVDTAGKTKTPSAGADAATAMARCEQCHTVGLARVFAADWDQGPAAPDDLERTLSIFVPEGEAADGREAAYSQRERLERSACFRGAEGRMRCSTCHDPHGTPADPVAAMAARCGACHAQEACKRPRPSSAAPSVDCAGCHMLRPPSTETPHSGTTDHWIRRRPTVRPGAATTSALGRLPALAGGRKSSSTLSLAEQKARLGVARLRVADQHHDAAALQAAEATLVEALQADPDNSQALAGLGYIDILRARWTQAADHLEHALRATPQNDAQRLRLVRALVGAERLPEAAEQLALMSLESDVPDEVRREAARVAALRGDAEAAVALFQAATAARPSDSALHRELGTVFLQVGRFDDALHAFAAACRWSACNVQDYLLFAQFFVQSQAPAQGVSMLDFGREILGPKVGTSLEEEAVALEAAHNLDEGLVKRLGRAFDRNPGDAAAALRFGDRLFEMGQATVAIEVYEKCVAMGGATEPLLRRLGVAYGVSGKLPAAESHLRRAVEVSKQGGEAETWNELGMALTGQSRRTEAIEAFRQATRRDPKFAFPWFNMALAFQELGKIDEALAAVQSGLAIAPNDGQAIQLRRTLAIALHGTNLPPAELDRLAPVPPSDAPSDASSDASSASPP